MTRRTWSDPTQSRPVSIASEVGADAGTLSFTVIYQQYFDFVWATARSLGVRPEAIDDVVQEIFLVIHFKITTLRQVDSLRSWIYGVVRRRVSGHLRSKRLREQSAAQLAAESTLRVTSPPTPLDLKELSARSELLFACLGQLPWRQREVFVLAELDEMTAPEIAEALRIPVNTVYSRLRKARMTFEAARKKHERRK